MSKPASLPVVSIAIASSARSRMPPWTATEAVQVARYRVSDLVHVAPLRLDAATQPPDDVADLIDQLRLAPSQGPVLVPVHTVFPYGEARNPSYNPLRLQGLASLARAPAAIYHGADLARLNPLRARSLSAEPDRDEAGAKYLMRRVLNLSGNQGTVL